MVTLSLCMIVKNEEDVLGRCLSSVKDVFDEIVIVDTGSTDRTKKIASQYTSRIYDFEWCDDFAAARNFSFSQATMEYTMWLDADDVVTEENRQLLLELKRTLSPEVDVVMMKYDTDFDDNDNPIFSYYRERILKTGRKFQWVGTVHEVIQPEGKILFTRIRIEHRKTRPTEPGRNLRIYEQVLAKGQVLDPRQKYYYARELKDNRRYDDAIKVYEEFLQDSSGWVENKIGACHDLAHCYYLKENPKRALLSLLRSFIYDEPRAEICCDLGQHFLDEGKYAQAAFWYEIAASRELNHKHLGFISPDCYGYLPAIQLCVCYDKLGQYEKAEKWNERAGSFKPNDPSYLHNKKYYETKRRLKKRY